MGLVTKGMSNSFLLFPFFRWLILSKFLHIMGLRMQFMLVVIYMQLRHIGVILSLLPLDKYI